MPRAAKPSKQRHDPLHVELEEDDALRRFGRVSKPGKRRADQGDLEEGDEDRGEDARMSRKILDLARDQQEEIARELGEEEWEDEEEQQAEPSRRARGAPTMDSDEEEDFEEGDVSGGEEYAELDIDPADHATLDALAAPAPGDGAGSKTLADLIFSKMEGGAVTQGIDEEGEWAHWNREKEEHEGPPDPRKGLNPKVVEVYTKVGYLLSRYKSGPLPKALKILPSLPHWAQLLALTEPTEWTPHATFACTKIFVSNLKPTEVRVFLEGVLLDKCRDDMRMNGGKLNVHLYEALKKSLYKPAAFFKGILFPLCELQLEGSGHRGVGAVKGVGSCASLGRRIASSSIDGLFRPQLALHPYSARQEVRLAIQGRRRLGIPLHPAGERTAQPDRRGQAAGVVAPEHACVCSAVRDDPYVSSLLFLCKFPAIYGSDLTPDQKDALLDVIRVRPHPTISAEIRREIVNSVERGAPRPEDGDDVVMR
ncbi:snoRNA-binding rRNA-processing protein [Saitozyma podzolica]|uniref:SnoRNA-binding rRNA-processing protein n=1 Tax=Saitozyma podzolica TaxID=1890683 RepID=A0A427YIX4_9TREE|nr:snoRNA-binding rRNA-processing protein [Saitozyma podzolica]